MSSILMLISTRKMQSIWVEIFVDVLSDTFLRHGEVMIQHP